MAGQVQADPAGFLRLTWHNHPRQLADAQALLRAVSGELRQRHWGRVLTDQALMPPFTPTEQQWVSETWLPEAIDAGYRFGAVVLAHNVLSRLATAAITTSSHGGQLRYRSFDTPEAAAAWLEQQ